jgi:hypothetical protein
VSVQVAVVGLPVGAVELVLFEESFEDSGDRLADDPVTLAARRQGDADLCGRRLVGEHADRAVAVQRPSSSVDDRFTLIHAPGWANASSRRESRKCSASSSEKLPFQV